MIVRRISRAGLAAGLALLEIGLLSVASPAVAECSFTGTCHGGMVCGHGGSGRETFPSLSACQAARSAVMARADAMGGGFSASACSCTGAPASGSSVSSPSSGPSPAEQQRRQRERQEQAQRLQREAQRREQERQRAFEAAKVELLDDLASGLGSVSKPLALRQLECSVSRANEAVGYFRGGEYTMAMRLSRASVGEDSISGTCIAGGSKLPEVPLPVDETDSPEARYFEETGKEITEIVEVLSVARRDVEGAQRKSKRAEQQVKRQQDLVDRLMKAPPSPERESGVDQANDLLAKAQALLSQAKAAEKEADDSLAALADREERLTELEQSLADAIEATKDTKDEKQQGDVQ